MREFKSGIRTPKIDIPGTNIGQLLYYDGTSYISLPNGVPGNMLITKGNGIPPAWVGTSLQLVVQNSGGYVLGNYYDNSYYSGNTITKLATLNNIELMVYSTWKDLTISEIGISVIDNPNGSFKIMIFDNDDVHGWAKTNIFTSNEIIITNNGYNYANCNFTFLQGHIYWLAVHYNSTSTIKAIPLYDMPNFGLIDKNSDNYNSCLQKIITFGDSILFWAFDKSQLTHDVGTSIRFRSN